MATAPNTNRTSILVVDDNLDALKLIELCLISQGYEVTCASGGRQALGLIANESFDLVLTDLLMPDVDGVEVLAALREHQPDAHVIVMSGGGQFLRGRDLLKLGLKLGADTELPKPFSAQQLLDVVSRYARNPERIAGAA